MTSTHEAHVQVSDEQVAPVGRGIELCYQTFSTAAGGEPLVLVMGLGGPLNWWDPELCRMLARAGFHVVRFDNRDTGRSTRVDQRVRRGQLVRGFVGRDGRPPYTLDDMAADAFGLMDHLGWESAHVAGVSMGGMIVQTMAVTRPERVRSVTSIMSTLGRRSVGWISPALVPGMLAPRKPGKAAYVEMSSRIWRRIGSPGYPQPEEKTRSRAAETFERGVSASGVMRQLAAIVHQPDRSPALRTLAMPACVIHGDADKMVHVSGGLATARAIPGAELVLVPGMGHDLPPELFEVYVAALRRTADRARPRS